MNVLIFSRGNSWAYYYTTTGDYYQTFPYAKFQDLQFIFKYIHKAIKIFKTYAKIC